MCLNFCFHHLNYKLKLLRSFLPGCVKQSVRPLSQAGTYPTHPLRFLILCTFNSELNCDLYMTIIPADRQEFDKKPYHCPGAQLPSSAQPDYRLRALLPAHHSSCHLASLRFHTPTWQLGGWGAPSCSGVMKWYFRSVVCLVWWETDLCPWWNLPCNHGEHWTFFILSLILIFDIMQFLNNFVSAAQSVSADV